MCATAAATPSVHFKAQAVPIRGFPGTGNFYGAGASVQVEFLISGKEYRGFAPPLTEVKLYLPMGLKLRSAGFPTCRPGEVEVVPQPPGPLPRGCPRGSIAGPAGVAEGVLPQGGEAAHETLEVEPVYSPGGGIYFSLTGHSPVLLESLWTGRFAGLAGAGGYGPELITEVPLVESGLAHSYMSLERILLQTGSAYKRQGIRVYYATVPRMGQCPKGGFRWQAELTFADPANLSVPGETVTAGYRSPCPRRRAGGKPEESPPGPTLPPVPVVTPAPTPPPVSSLPPVPSVPQVALPGTGGTITAPSNAACVSSRDLVVHLVSRSGLTYREARAYLNGRRVLTRRGAQVTAPLDVRGLPKGTYVLRLTAVTSSGRRISGTRTYRACAARPTRARENAKL